MISQDEIKGLSADPELAFVQYETIVRAAMMRDRHEEGDDVERTYITYVLAFIHEYSIDLDVPDELPFESNRFWSYYNDFIKKIDYYKARVQLRSFHRNTHSGVSAVVALTADYRAEIHSNLASIRKIISAVDMKENRREALLSKVNALAAEVDRNRTRLEAFMSMYLDVTHDIGEGADNLEPLMNKIERLAKIFGKAKAENETGQLPAPPERKLITGPAPEEQTSKPIRRDDLDDEIPF